MVRLAKPLKRRVPKKIGLLDLINRLERLKRDIDIMRAQEEAQIAAFRRMPFTPRLSDPPTS